MLCFPIQLIRLGDPCTTFPADRAGVMHAHQIIVSSAMERATRAGIDQLSEVPALSGVLADFLKQLIKINNEPLVRHEGRSYMTKKHAHPVAPDRCHLLTKAAKHLESKVLGGDVHSEASNNSAISYPEFSYTPHGWSDHLPLMFASSMVSELSPVVLYLRRVVAPGDVLIIEEPEAHLHPDLQVKFVNVLAEIVKAGVQIIMTTHSEWVLDAVANLVLSSEVDGPSGNGSSVSLSSQEVGLWSFASKKRSTKKGSTVREIKFDPDKGGYVTEFENSAVDIYNEWAGS